MGKRVVHCGAHGAGQAAKICNNMILGVSMIAVSEAFVLGEKLGLTHQALFDVASAASGQCWALTTNCPVPGPVPTSPANRDYQPGFAGALMAKDLKLALNALQSTGVAARLGPLASEIYDTFAAEGGAGRDFSGIITDIRDKSEAGKSEAGTSKPAQSGHEATEPEPDEHHLRGPRMTEQYANILVERRGRVGLVTLNRPEALNALNKATMDELVKAVTGMDADPEVGAVVVTGSAKAFAAGADIKEMQSKGYMDMYAADWFRGWEDFTRLRIPVVAAVSGFALGGGCELAMMCDFIIAGDNAKFGQPEINLGVLPGMGGSQRLTRAVGKSKAMDMILTGRFMDAEEAERAGLVSRVVPAADVVEEALKAAEVIASKSKPVAMVAKEAVNAAFETGLAQGVLFERRVFHSLFATEDQKEGMAAFTEKRQPEFNHR